jgi:PHD/YefM family antitoxin component YafN of YafNO toxin-antitoxin module
MSATHPVPTSVARRELTQTVSRFREEGLGAEPVVFGSHRKAEAVVLPYEAYEALMELAEEYAIASRIRERDQADSGQRYTLEEVADEFGIDLDTL